MNKILLQLAILIAITGGCFLAYDPVNNYAQSLEVEAGEKRKKAVEAFFTTGEIRPDGRKEGNPFAVIPRNPYKLTSMDRNPLSVEAKALSKKAAFLQRVAVGFPIAGTVIFLIGLVFWTAIGLTRLQRGKAATDDAPEAPDAQDEPTVESSTLEVTHV